MDKDYDDGVKDKFLYLEDQSMDEMHNIDDLQASIDTNASPTKRACEPFEGIGFGSDTDAPPIFEDDESGRSDSSEPPEIPGSPIRSMPITDYIPSSSTKPISFTACDKNEVLSIEEKENNDSKQDADIMVVHDNDFKYSDETSSSDESELEGKSKEVYSGGHKNSTYSSSLNLEAIGNKAGQIGSNLSDHYSSLEKQDRPRNAQIEEKNTEEIQHLSPQIQDLIKYIKMFTPMDIELESKFRPFIPNYMPSVGDVFHCLSVPRPDLQDDGIGRRVLDEPSLAQSNVAELELRIRNINIKKKYESPVHSIEDAEHNPSLIDMWIDSVTKIHKEKPNSQIVYRKNMPSIDDLMKVWPKEFEDLLNNIDLPPPSLNLTLLEYAKVICAFLDVPVYDNILESLHLIFMLYFEFNANQHFKSPL